MSYSISSQVEKSAWLCWSWTSNLSNAFIDQTNPDNILDYEQKVDALTVQDLQKAAQKFFNMSNYVKTVLYPENFTIPESPKKGF